ncbi:MAG: MBL fold metallo-hydrolase [Spirochaetota bacterium]
MNACIHRGSKEIGGSCVEVVSNGKRIIIDLGLLLDAKENNSSLLPNVKGLDGNDDLLLAIIISHIHLDHFGLLAYVDKKIPVIMGKAARNIATAAAPFMPGAWTVPNAGLDMVSEKSFVLGPFTITPFLTDHSGYDAYSLLIEADGKRLFYSGDLRMHGAKAKLTERMIEHAPENINVLLLEGSSLGRIDSATSFPSEEDIEEQFVKEYERTAGMVLVQVSSQNIDRIVKIFRACKRTGRRLVIDLYSAVILEATGNENIPQSDWPEVAVYIPQRQRVQIKNEKWFELLQHHSTNRIYLKDLKEISERSVLLFRSLHMSDLEQAGCLRGASYIYSLREGYWEQGSYDHIRNWLEKHSIPKVSIHTSGHASPADLKRFADGLKPRRIVPIHTFAPEKYSELFDNVEFHNDGKYWEV